MLYIYKGSAWVPAHASARKVYLSVIHVSRSDEQGHFNAKCCRKKAMPNKVFLQDR